MVTREEEEGKMSWKPREGMSGGTVRRVGKCPRI